MKSKLFFFFLVLITISCKKEKKNIFTGITETDETGFIRSVDDSDWNFLDNWDEKEAALFASGFDKLCTAEEGLFAIAYPNPCKEVATVEWHIPEGGTIFFRLVDKDYTILLSRDSVDKIAIDFSHLGINNDIVRIYYKILRDNCEYRGHGDIKIKSQ